MRGIFKEAGFSPYKEYMKNRHAKQSAALSLLSAG
jgi:hypothetical protein